MSLFANNNSMGLIYTNLNILLHFLLKVFFFFFLIESKQPYDFKEKMTKYNLIKKMLLGFERREQQQKQQQLQESSFLLTTIKKLNI